MLKLNLVNQYVELKAILTAYKALMKDREERPRLSQPAHSIREWNARTLKSMRDAFQDDNHGFEVLIAARRSNDGRIHFDQHIPSTWGN